MNYSEIVSFIRKTFSEPENMIILHDPRFCGNERKYLLDAMDSNFVSSVGEYVGKFEKAIADYTGAKYAVAAVNGTSALHISLLLAGVHPDEEVITQPVSFIATCNAISYCNAHQKNTTFRLSKMPRKVWDPSIRVSTRDGSDSSARSASTETRSSRPAAEA